MYTIKTKKAKGDILMNTSTVSARLTDQTLKKLDQLAKATARSKSFLVAEAVQAYVEEQAWQIKAIKEGIRQADDGNFARDEDIEKVLSNWGVDAD